jgi:Fur family ferric uptake transcriptional regulator
MKKRRTRQLVAVEAVLRESHDHPTAAQIHARVARMLPRVSLGTVYRNLEKLVRAGGALSVRLDGEVTRYDGRLEAHDHFVCRRCGGVTDLLDGAGPQVDVSRLERAGYAVDAHRLALFGTCSGCR